jgi:hypothetical protein
LLFGTLLKILFAAKKPGQLPQPPADNNGCLMLFYLNLNMPRKCRHGVMMPAAIVFSCSKVTTAY